LHNLGTSVDNIPSIPPPSVTSLERILKCD